MKLIIMGNASTMTRHPFYRKLYEYVQSLNRDGLDSMPEIAVSD
jgi:hypothetical protein